jgi:hypothetical protein
MSGNGKGGSNRRGFRHRDREKDNWSKDNSNSSCNKKKGNTPRFDKSRGVLIDRPKWTPPQVSAEPIPVPDCPYCGKPITDLATAIADKDSGQAVHFDCIIGRLAENETLERGDAIAYIGGGRFGVVHFNNPQENRIFSIKKIIEWENKDERVDWRRIVADHFSVT